MLQPYVSENSCIPVRLGNPRCVCSTPTELNYVLYCSYAERILITDSGRMRVISDQGQHAQTLGPDDIWLRAGTNIDGS